MATLQFILDKFNIDLSSYKKMPIEFLGLHRDGLAKLFYELGFTTGVEIGVENGIFSATLCKGNPGLKLYSVDPWAVYDEYGEVRGGTQTNQDARYDVAKKRLSGLNCEVIRDFSMNAVKKFKNKSLDFVYIDGNHMFDYTMQDMIEWSKKVRTDGIIAGHDYQKYKQNPLRVIEAVNSYVWGHSISPWFVFGRSNADMKCPRSWMWVNKE